MLLLITNTLPGQSASEVTTLWRYTNMFIIIIIINKSVGPRYCPTEIYAGRVACCPLVSHGE